MTRTEALEAFFAAVDLHMPQHALAGRSAIRQAGIDYASAAAQDAVTSTLAICQRQDDDRHLLDGVTATPAPQTEGLLLVSDSTQEPSQ
jgi:hypothetical protein